MIRWPWVASVAVGLVVAFAAGRLTAPRPVVVAEKKTENTAERKTWDETKAATVATDAKSATTKSPASTSNY